MRFGPLWLCLASLTAAAADGVLVDRIVAVVDLHPITRSAVLARVHLAQRLAKDQRAEADARRAALDELIEERLIAQDAEQVKLEVSEADVDAALQAVADQNKLTLEQLRGETTAQGLDWAAYRAMLGRKILEMKWLSVRADHEGLSKAPSIGEYMLSEKRRLLAELRAAAAVEVRP